MSERNNGITMEKIKVMERLRDAEEIYVLISACTRMPYVVCDAESFDDEVFLFFEEEAAKVEAKRLIGEKNPIQIARVEKDMRLQFFTSLYPMGVNCMLVDKGNEGEMAVQLRELITRNESAKVPEGQVRVENPELHLTALYLAQATRVPEKVEMTEELKNLDEEMKAHFTRGQYIVPVSKEEGKGIPILTQKDGKQFVPVFTDLLEFQKFDREKSFTGAVMSAAKIPGLMSEQMEGVVVNPFGVNVLLKLVRTENQ